MDVLLEKYGESHQNSVNKFIHWVCVPSIMFSLFGLLYAIPFFTERTLFTNWATYVLVLALVYYMRLSKAMFFGFLLIGSAMVYGVHTIYEMTYGDAAMLAIISFIIFVVAWILQFIGHKIEGKKPSFLEDLQFLLIGPAWLLHFIYKKVGISY